MQIPDELVAFFESGVAIVMATRDAYLAPEGLRIFGLRVGNDRTTLTAFLPIKSCSRVMANLEHNGEVAISLCQPTTYRTYQVKGTYLNSKTDAPPELVQRYLDLFVDETRRAGVVPGMMRGIEPIPCIAVDFRVRDVFLQTPGAGAGERL